MPTAKRYIELCNVLRPIVSNGRVRPCFCCRRIVESIADKIWQFLARSREADDFCNSFNNELRSSICLQRLQGVSNYGGLYTKSFCIEIPRKERSCWTMKELIVGYNFVIVCFQTISIFEFQLIASIFFEWMEASLSKSFEIFTLFINSLDYRDGLGGWKEFVEH